MRSCYLLFIFALSLGAHATEEIDPEFGFELTFSDLQTARDFSLAGGMFRNGIPSGLKKTIKRVQKLCTERQDVHCSLKTIIHDQAHAIRLTVTPPSGKSFFLEFTDGTGVIEVTGTPMTIDELEQNHAFINEFVFRLERSLGLTPKTYIGGGHVNINADIFQKNPKLFRDFIIDYYNHPILANGVFEKDIFNAKGSAAWDKTEYDKFASAIKDFM